MIIQRDTNSDLTMLVIHRVRIKQTVLAYPLALRELAWLAGWGIPYYKKPRGDRIGKEKQVSE